MKNRPLRSVAWLLLLVLIIPWGVQSMGASGGDAQVLMLLAYLGIPALILLSRLVEWLISGDACPAAHAAYCHKHHTHQTQQIADRG